MAPPMETETRLLVKILTGFAESEENFDITYEYVISNLRFHKFLSVDAHKIQRSLEGMSEKFQIHHQFEKAAAFMELCETFLHQQVFESRDKSKTDTHYAALSLLLSLAQSPINAEYIRTKEPIQQKEIESFDWKALLLEGEDIQLGPFLESPPMTDEEDDDASDESTLVALPTPKLQLRPDATPLLVESPGVDSMTPQPLDSPYLAYPCADLECDWLRENIVAQYWTEGFERKVDGWTALSNLHEEWERHVCDTNPLYTPAVRRFITEYEVIREVIWMLCGSRELYVFRWTGAQFVPNPSVSLTHLTDDALSGVLSHLAGYGTTVQRLSRFIEFMADRGRHVNHSGVTDSVTNGVRSGATGTAETGYVVSQTHEAFAAALSDVLQRLSARLCMAEQQACTQENCVTLSSLIEDLSPFFKQLGILDFLLTNGVTVCGGGSTNGVAAGGHVTSVSRSVSHLLNVIYSALLEAERLGEGGAERLELLLPLWLKTARPYINIAHRWIHDGILIDPCREFIVHRNEEVRALDEHFWDDAFTLDCFASRELGQGQAAQHGCVDEQSGDWVPQFLLPVLKDVVQTGKSMQLLLKLGRHRDVSHAPSLPDPEESLYDAYVASMTSPPILPLGADPLLVDESPGGDKPENNPAFVAEGGAETHPGDVTANRSADRTIVSGPRDALMDANFVQIFAVEEKTDSQVSSQTFNCSVRASESMQRAGFQRPALQERVSGRREAVCGSVLAVLLNDCHLVDCLTAIRHFFLMEAGHAMHEFCTALFDQMRGGGCWRDAPLLNTLLQQALSLHHPRHADRLFIVVDVETAAVKVTPGCATVSTLNCIKLCYQVEWPVDLVLNMRSMLKYNQIFQFLLQIKWVKYSLDQLKFADLNKVTERVGASQILVGGARVGGVARTDQSETRGGAGKGQSWRGGGLVHRMQLFRMKLLQFVNSFNNYIMTRTLHSLGLEFTSDLGRAGDLDRVIDLHSAYLSLLHERCLLHSKVAGLKEVISKVLDMALCVSDIWSTHDCSTVSVEALEQMEVEFNRYITFLSSMIGSFASRGSFPHLESLAFALVTCSQTTSHTIGR